MIDLNWKICNWFDLIDLDLSDAGFSPGSSPMEVSDQTRLNTNKINFRFL